MGGRDRYFVYLILLFGRVYSGKDKRDRRISLIIINVT